MKTLLIIAIVCVPVMLYVKPFYLKATMHKDHKHRHVKEHEEHLLHHKQDAYPEASQYERQ